MRTIRSVLLVTTGGAVAYFLDPRLGAERRRRVRAAWERRGAVPADDAGTERTGGVAVGPAGGSAVRPRVAAPGTDTATGTDRAAKYTGPGYEDVSFGQATARDAELADRLVVESQGDLDAAARRFASEATGSQVLAPEASEPAQPASSR